MKTLLEMTDQEIQDEVRRLEGELDRRHFPFKNGDIVLVTGRVIKNDGVKAFVELGGTGELEFEHAWVRPHALQKPEPPF